MVKQKSTSPASGRPPVCAENVNLRRVSISAVAEKKGVSRQAAWVALGDGRLNGVCISGVWMVYVDEKFAEWHPNRPHKNRT